MTGDGVTILNTKFINFMCHEYGKGVMLCKIKDCTERLTEVGSIRSTFIAHEMMESISVVGPKTVYLFLLDGGADWVATETMVQSKWPWIYFMHCVTHECSLILKDVCAIQEIHDLTTWMTDCQKWFQTHKLSALLKSSCQRRYKTSRSFVFPAETRFAGKLLQFRRFLDMKDALQSVVRSEQYRLFNFDNDIFADRISGDQLWTLISRVCKAAGPLLLLFRLSDSDKPTLSKLKGTIDYIKTLMQDSGEDTLEDKICASFHNRAPELDCDIANAAYVLDPEFIHKSRYASADVMASFWKVARTVLRITDDSDWEVSRRQLVADLSAFQTCSRGSGLEDYENTETPAFWAVAGCHAPLLGKLALRITPLPCSSGAAERNWAAVKGNLTKKRNRLTSTKMEKMVFVRRFTRLKRSLFGKDLDSGFKDWVKELLKQAADTGHESDSDNDPEGVGDEVHDGAPNIFQDHIEPGEQGRINGREPGAPRVNLTQLRKDHSARSWLFEKYYKMCLVDKSPEGDDLSDEDEWEHRTIRDIKWWRSKGYTVETVLRDSPDDPEVQRYFINTTLHQMIRDSPHNTRPMASQQTV